MNAEDSVRRKSDSRPLRSARSMSTSDHASSMAVASSICATVDVPRGKSTVAQIDEATAMLEAWSDVDMDLADLNGLESDFRLTESSAFIESMNQKMEIGRASCREREEE